MKFLLSTLFIILSVAASAQNFDCLQAGAKNYFINGKGYVRGIRIDSVTSSGSDQIFYPYKTQRISKYLTGTAPVSFEGGSWLGGKVIRRADGTYLFDNLWDTVVIKTHAPLGASWTFYDDTSHFSYTAMVTSIDTMTIFGVLDSVKKISVFCDSDMMSYANDPVNNFQIWIGKNFGFVQVFDLYTFPYHKPDTIAFTPPHTSRHIRFIDYYLDVVLGNLGTCDLGCANNAPDTVNSIFRLFNLYNPRRSEIYNFAVGDAYENHFVANGVYTPYFFQSYTLDSVFTKTTGTSGITYTGSERTMGISLAATVPTTRWDTTYTVGPYNQLGDTAYLISKLKMPEESTADYLLHYFPKNIPYSGLCDSPAAYVLDQDYKATGFGYDGTVYRASYTSNTYSKGYGLTGKSNFNSTTGTVQQQSYNFYYKSADTCGYFVSASRPHNAGVGNISGNNRFTILPNPASGHISISCYQSLNSDISITVYDVTGRAVFTDKANLLNTYSINTFSWINGLYLVAIQDNEGTIQKEKVVIQK